MFYIVSLYSLQAKGNSEGSKRIRQARFEYVADRTAQLMKAGTFCFSPITHCHEMSNRNDMPKDYTFWKENDRHFIDISEGVVVLCMQSSEGLTWKDSEGMSDEIAYARSIGKPVIFLDASDYEDPVIPPSLMEEYKPSVALGRTAITSRDALALSLE